MKKLLLATFIGIVLTILQSTPIYASTYSQRLCKSDANLHCITIKKNDSWSSLWPDPIERDMVQRFNRMNTSLYKGMRIAVPNNLKNMTLLDLAPFESNIGYQDRKTILVDTNDLAWGAYDENGQLINWGPISAGKSYCPDVGKHCTTPNGTYFIYRKEGRKCFSTKFPMGKGGAPMPYCMFFHGGFALHGSPAVPGYNASHGCVRTFTEDARWLNQEFINLPESSQEPTKVIVQ